LARYANHEAAAFYRQALELQPGAAERFVLLDGLGRALARQTDFVAATMAWQEAIEGYRRAGDSSRAARLYARQGRAAFQNGDVPGSLAVTRAALRALQG